MSFTAKCGSETLATSINTVLPPSRTASPCSFGHTVPGGSKLRTTESNSLFHMKIRLSENDLRAATTASTSKKCSGYMASPWTSIVTFELSHCNLSSRSSDNIQSLTFRTSPRTLLSSSRTSWKGVGSSGSARTGRLEVSSTGETLSSPSRDSRGATNGAFAATTNVHARCR